MKHIGHVAVLAILLSVPLAGTAQEKKPAAAAAAKPAPKPAPAKPQAAPAKPAAAAAAPEKQPAVNVAADASRRSRANEDARACLQHPTNLEIHRCAHDYR